MERICDVNADALKDLIDQASRAGSDDGICPVNVAFEISERVLVESCGKGVMCRDGMRQVNLILGDRKRQGQGR